MFHGSCACGAVRFRISEKPRFVAACHCSRCRKLGATPFAMVEAASLAIESGREGVVEYRPEPPFRYTRSFCGRCGTSLGELTSQEKAFPIPVNCFDDDLGMEIRFHEHVATRPSWLVVPEGAKTFEGDPG